MNQSFNERVKTLYPKIQADPSLRRNLQQVGWAGPLVESKLFDEDRQAVATLLEDGVLMRTHYVETYPSWILDTTTLGEEILIWINKRNKRCPTCKVNPGICCICKHPIEKWEQILEPDPYDEDLKGDDRHHLQHERCKILAADEL